MPRDAARLVRGVRRRAWPALSRTRVARPRRWRQFPSTLRGILSSAYASWVIANSMQQVDLVTKFNSPMMAGRCRRLTRFGHGRG